MAPAEFGKPFNSHWSTVETYAWADMSDIWHECHTENRSHGKPMRIQGCHQHGYDVAGQKSTLGIQGMLAFPHSEDIILETAQKKI